MLQIKNTLGGGKPEGLYAWKKCENNTDHTFIDYVVSDKETAYPDGGEKGGYWYEKVVDGLDLSSIGFTKAEFGEITCSSKNSFSISHSLGVAPKIILLMATGWTSYGKIKMLVLTRYVNGNAYYYQGAYATENTTGGVTVTDIFESYYYCDKITIYSTANESKVTFNYDQVNNAYFNNGGKYKYLFLG